jgi:hypothetical protein
MRKTSETKSDIGDKTKKIHRHATITSVINEAMPAVYDSFPYASEHAGVTKQPLKKQTQYRKRSSPSDCAIILPLASKSATQLNTGPKP